MIIELIILYCVMMRKHHVSAMCVVCQTKVSKLVVQIGGDEYVGAQNSTPATPRSPSSGDSYTPFGTRDPQQQDQLVRVCSWTDRRESGGGGIPKSPTAELADDLNHCMPSVRELAKQFSSNVSALSLCVNNIIICVICIHNIMICKMNYWHILSKERL